MLFSYGRVVSGSQFYDRQVMQDKVLYLVNNMQSFMLKAPRRYGKTSLLKYVYDKHGIDHFYIDFRKTPRLELFNEKLINYLYSKMGIEGALKQIKDNAIAFLRTYKTKVSVDLELFEMSVELFSKTSDVRQEEQMVKVLDLLDELAKKQNSTFHIVMDEFQDSTKLSSDEDILEIMRGTIQHHEHICYVFAGSNMTMMTKIFENKRSPFYNFCRKLTLDSFEYTELFYEITKAFKRIQTVFESDEILKGLLKRLKGHPANTMLVLSIIEGKVSNTDTMIIKQNLVDEAYDEAQEEMSDLVNEYLKEIKSKEHLHDVIYRIANDEKQILEPRLLQQKKKALVDMGYLLNPSRGEYHIIDGFLEDDLKNV